jgi:hypothetical protein
MASLSEGTRQAYAAAKVANRPGCLWLRFTAAIVDEAATIIPLIPTLPSPGAKND